MTMRGFVILSMCIVAIQLLEEASCLPPPDAETRARLEEKAMSSISLRDLEKMVENDERVKNVGKETRLVIIPKKKNGRFTDDEEAKAYIIHKKPKKFVKKEQVEHYDDEAPSPEFRYGSIERFDAQLPSFFEEPELEVAASSPVKDFYESIVERVMKSNNFKYHSVDPMAALEFASSDAVPLYQPRFDYDSHSKDSTETKLKGKSYWRDAPERREEKIDDNGCKMVIKKIADPEAESSTDSTAKSVIITKECEYPSLDGPDAKIPDVDFPLKNSRLDTKRVGDYQPESRPLEVEKSHKRNPLATDYIDRMLDAHFSSFRGFNSPITSFKGYQDRFNLRRPEGLENVKPHVKVESYEYTHPQSGLDSQEDTAREVTDKEEEAPKFHEQHYHYSYPDKKYKSRAEGYESDDKIQKKYALGQKDPKMIKKSFAYYRKDNPKNDPNEQQYAEEYAQGNYRSFSSSYDSERDGPKKQ